MKFKSTLIILVTLIVGIVIGFLINGQITHRKFKRVVEMGMEEGFKNRLYNFIQPTADQKELIDPIIEDYARKNSAIFKNVRSEHDSLMDVFHEELKPLLNEDQLSKLEDMGRRPGKWDKKPHDRRRPPR